MSSPMVKKRDGRIVDFDRSKIVNAIMKAFADANVKERPKALKDADTLYSLTYALEKSNNIADYVSKVADKTDEPLDIESIQDLVENGLMATKRKDVAKAYILYRDERTKARSNTTDKTILEIVGCNNDYWLHENSNKNAELVTTQRDYCAGAISTDIAERKLLPKAVVEAHKKGIIHFHDMDYFLQSLHNCDLVNLEDMLQNGTVISGTYIDKPHKFSTACNIATQIIAQVASSQYGGQSISLAHLSPFINETRKTIHKKHPDYTDKQIHEAVLEDIADGVQTLQYQIITLTKRK
jgi:ribonucleoside-triphosphate reductase